MFGVLGGHCLLSYISSWRAVRPDLNFWRDSFWNSDSGMAVSAQFVLEWIIRVVHVAIFSDCLEPMSWVVRRLAG